jgi:prepilin-type N-terminal cleavage/methylation domain-containing protein
MRASRQQPRNRRRSSPQRSALRRGLSFVELLVVVLIMSILAAAAVPTFYDSLLFHRVESAARRVKVDLELARNTARLTSAAQSITFNNNDKSYTASADLYDLDRPGQVYSVILATAPYNLTTVIADFGDLNLPSTEARFDGYGKPLRGGTVLLQADNDHKCTVELDGTTGQVKIISSQSRGRVAQAVGN